MKCRSARKLIFKFIDGLDDDTQRLEVEQHLAQCQECEKFALELTRSMDLLHRAPEETTSDNFAWNVRLRLNQERNAIRERSASFGTLIRLWNVRYATTAVAAAAVVLVGGWYVVKSGMVPVILEAPQSPSVARTDPGADETPPPAPPSQRPNLFGQSPRFGLVGEGTRPGGASRGLINVDVGPSLIDRTEPMTGAEMDSLMSSQLEGLTLKERMEYLSQYMHVLQRHMLRAQVINRHSR